MWRLLRDRQIAGAKFRRQHPLAPYVLDFYCHDLKLAIELDGGQHNEQPQRARDQQRDAFLQAVGIGTLRFWNNQVLRETESVMETIYEQVMESMPGKPSPNPLPVGEGFTNPLSVGAAADEGKLSSPSGKGTERENDAPSFGTRDKAECDAHSSPSGSGIRGKSNALPSPSGRGAGGEGQYLDFAPEVTDRRALADIVNEDAGVATAHKAFLETLDAWWERHLPHIEALARTDNKQGNVYELRRLLLSSISDQFPSPSGRGARGEGARGAQTLLSDHQVRGALARYFEFFKPEFKSIAFSGWGPELIPDDDILQSQFPEVLAEMEAKRLRLAELTALFSVADEEDYEDVGDTGVLPGEQVKTLKAKLKEAKGAMKLAKRDPGLGDWKMFQQEAEAIDVKVARHKALEDEARQIKAGLRATEKKDELVAAAREKIDRDEARRVIINRLHRVLVQTYESYLRADQRACLSALGNLHSKYAVTAEDIEVRRDRAAVNLKRFLGQLGYVQNSIRRDSLSTDCGGEGQGEGD